MTKDNTLRTLVNDLVQVGNGGYSDRIFSLRKQIIEAFDAVSPNPEASAEFGAVVDRLIDNANGGYEDTTSRLSNDVIARYAEAAL